MLSKPQHGWTSFALGDVSYSIGYLTNIPLDWLDRAIFGLESLLPFEICGYCEPGKMICTVYFSECRIVFENNKHRSGDSSFVVVPINMLDFCKILHEDISAYVDDWSKWSLSYETAKEDLQSRLDRLQKLIRIKENCFV